MSCCGFDLVSCESATSTRRFLLTFFVPLRLSNIFMPVRSALPLLF